MKKRFRMLAFVLGLTLALCGCTKTPTNDGEKLNVTVNKTNKNENENQNKLYALRPLAYSTVEGLNLEPGSYISIIGRYSGDSYWKQVEAGAKRAVDDINSMLGYKGEDKIKLTYSAPDVRDDVDEQINILDEELARYPIAIGIAAIDTSACLVQFDLAIENGIPIVTMDSGSDYQNVVAHVATHNIDASGKAAEELAALMENSGEVLMIVQDSFSMTAKDREEGFVNALAEDSPEINVVDIYHLDEYAAKAQEIALERTAELEEGAEPIDPTTISEEDVLKYYIEKHPDLKAIYATNLDTTQLITKIVTSLGRDDLIIVGFDGGDEQMKLLEAGTVDGLIIQNPYGMGYATVVAAARNALGLGNQAFVDCGYTWVTKENLDDPVVKKMIY